jgi:predicted ATPase
LVVLDNCEHLLPAAADVAQALLEGCTDVSVLATSRARLGLPGERDWRVPSLSLPAERDPLTQSDAVRLFVERAAAQRPNFQITNETTPVVARICRALDGIPLAIELAAARRRMLSLDQIAAGLGDRFHLLTGGARTALPRQQTLRASVEWSYDLLPPDERLLFRRLPVFAGGFTLAAVEDVCADEELERHDILDLLASLIDNSLVMVEEGGPDVRYRLLETVREYASERLAESAGVNALRARHRDFFLGLAESVAAEPAKGRRARWLEPLDPEAANLTAALDLATETDGDRALRLCVALHHWWRLRGLFNAAERGFTKALEAADPGPSASRARALASHAHLLINEGDYLRAIETAEQARAMAEELGDDTALAGALDILGTIRLFPDPIGCRPVLERARELAGRSGVVWCQIDATQMLTWSFLLCDEYEKAELLLADVLPLIERTGYRDYVISWYWYGMSYGALMRADADRFLELAKQAVAAAEEVGDPVSWGGAHACMAILEVAQGRAEAAAARLEASRDRMIATGAGIALPWTETYLAQAHATVGDLEGARVGLEGVIESGADFGTILASALIQLADVLRVSGDVGGAESRAQEALEISHRVSSPILISRSKETLARLAAERGEWETAEILAREVVAPRIERGIWLYVPQALDVFAEAAAGAGRSEAAALILGAAERRRRDLGLVRWRPDASRFAGLKRSLRELIGEAAFEHARADGGAMSPEETAALVRGSPGPRRPAHAGAADEPLS